MTELRYCALIPATRSTAWAVAVCCAFQTVPPARIVVLDTAPRPLAADYEMRMALDIAAERGTQVSYLRGREATVAQVRIRLGDECRTPFMLWMDDDTMPEPGVAGVLLTWLSRHPGELMAACQLPTPNNDWNSENWCPPSTAPPAYAYAPATKTPERAATSLTGIMMRSTAWPAMRAVLAEHQPPPGEHPHEDLAVWDALGEPYVLPAATAWEMKHPGARAFSPYPDKL